MWSGSGARATLSEHASTACPPGAAPSGPTAWQAALDRAIGAPPGATPVEVPWPACATGLVRAPLEAERKRRVEEAQAKDRAARDAWDKAARAVSEQAKVGVFVREPEPKAPFKDRNALAASAIRAELLPSVSTPCLVVDVVAATAAPTPEEKAASMAAGQSIGPISGYHILCAESAAKDAARFLVTVPARLVAGQLSSGALTGWRFVPEGHFAPEVRGRVATVGVGEELTLTSLGRIRWGAGADPGFGWDAWREVRWAADFARSCPHEGDACTFNDGQPEVGVARSGPRACEAALVSKLDDLYEAWKRMGPTSKEAALVGSWIEILGATTPTAKRVAAFRKRLGGDLQGAATLYAEVQDVQGLVEVADLLFKKPETTPAGLKALDAAIAIDARPEWVQRAGDMALKSGDHAAAIQRFVKHKLPASLVGAAELLFKKADTLPAGLEALDAAIAIEARPAWLLRAGGMALQAGDSAKAIARLKACVAASQSAAELKEAAALLGFAGDAAAAEEATRKAATAGAR
jgi:hypothetical protein